MYIRLGVEWEIFAENDYLWLGNSLTNKLFKIADKEKQQMVRQIKDGITEQELIMMYPKYKWEQFKEELIQNKAIYYSKHKESYVDTMDRGGKLIETSSFIKSKMYISRVAIEINTTCTEECAFCNDDNEIPCLSCYKNAYTNSTSISSTILRKFWNDLKNIVVAEVLLTGGNLFGDFALIKQTIELIKNRQQRPKIYIICNNVVPSDNIDFLNDNNITLIINLIRQDELYLSEMKKFVLQMDLKRIQYILYNRVNVEEFEFLAFQKSRVINDIIENNQSIVTEENIVRNFSLDVNSLIGIKNMCTYGKVLLHTDGKLSVCREYGSGNTNVFEQNVINSLLTFEKIWNADFPTEKCKICNLRKICVNCPGIIEKYKTYSKFCFI